MSAVAAVAASAGACAEMMVEQEKESIVMIENNAINFFIFLKPVVVSFYNGIAALVVKGSFAYVYDGWITSIIICAKVYKIVIPAKSCAWKD